MKRPRVFLVALVVGALSLGGCVEDEPETAVEAFENQGEAAVELVTGEPFEAAGEVDKVLDGAFRLFDTFVVSDRAGLLEEGERVRVTGEVESAAELLRIRRGQLSDQLREALEDEELVVVATKVERLPETRIGS